MRRVIVALTLLSALLVSAARPSAQPSPPADARSRASAGAASESALSKRVSVDLKAMAPRDAFKVIASAIGYTAEVAPDVSTPVDIVVGNITARTALNTICESIGCTWQASGTAILVEKAAQGSTGRVRGRSGSRVKEDDARTAGVAELRRLMNQALPADMKFERAPLADVAARLSKATGLEIKLTETRTGETFSGDLGGRSLSEALKAIGAAKIAIIGRKGRGAAPSIYIEMAPRKRPR